MLIDAWDTADGGNSCSIVPVGEFDPTEVLENWLEVSSGGISYRKIGDGEAEVMMVSPSLTALDIPAVVIIDGEECRVTSIGDCAFYNCTDLISLTIPEGVMEIGSGAFYNCCNLASIDIPESVTKIGGYAFQLCTSLVSVVIPGGVVTVGDGAFWSCYNLLSFESKGEVELGKRVFMDCEQLEALYLNCSSISDGYFANFRSLKTVVLGNNVTSIGRAAFQRCDSLTSIIISGSVTNIGNRAFEHCYSLKKIIFEDGNEPLRLGYIYDDYYYDSCRGREYINNDGQRVVCDFVGLFFDCPLETLYLGRNLIYREEYRGNYDDGYYYDSSPFFNQTELTSVTVGQAVTEIGDYTFKTCRNLAEVHISDVASWCNVKFESAKSNPISITKSLYLNDTLVTELIIPESVTEIGDYAFYDCRSISSVNFPESITKIGTGAFYGIPLLNNFSDGVVYIGKVLYAYKGTMPENTLIKVKDGTVCIREFAFLEQDNLSSITFPKSVTEIGGSAFKGCTELTSVAIPEHVTTINDSTFLNCTALTSVNIPKGLRTVGENAFKGCCSLMAFEAPESVTYIGDYAFYGCSSLISLNTGDAASLGDSTFVGCYRLERVALNCRQIRNWFNEYPTIKEVVLGDKVEYFEYGPAFFSCTNLERVTFNCANVGSWFGRNTTIKEVVLADGVATVENNAFWGCSSLASIIIGKNVTVIGDGNIKSSCGAFDNCTSLKEVIFEDGDKDLFVGCNLFGPPGRGIEGLFYDCPLEKVYLGRNLSYYTHKYAGYSPFFGKSTLTSLTIGPEVTRIGDYAFYDCALDTITCYATVPPTCDASTFAGVDTSIPVYVPETSVADYLSAEVWKDFLGFVGVNAGIEQTTCNGCQTTIIYDLMGRRITDTEGLKGFYIVNGKKTVIK